MKNISATSIVLAVATILFLAWTALNTVFWPVEDYGNVTHAYAESTNQIARGMSIGVAGYLSVIGLTLSWHLGRRPAK